MFYRLAETGFVEMIASHFVALFNIVSDEVWQATITCAGGSVDTGLDVETNMSGSG